VWRQLGRRSAASYGARTRTLPSSRDRKLQFASVGEEYLSVTEHGKQLWLSLSRVTYYWSIHVTDGTDTTEGPTWRFETGEKSARVYLPLILRQQP
jgi:hypothetical protein